MENRRQRIVAVIESIDNVSITEPFTEEYGSVTGTIEITVGDLINSFKVQIALQYPHQFHDTETIRFVNQGMIEFDHVNGDGSICIHTQHSPDLEQKLRFDFSSLATWIGKYVIDREKDAHYEHIVVSPVPVAGIRQVMLFTDLDHNFKAGDFGEMEFSHLADGIVLKDRETKTYILQSVTTGGKKISCKWNKGYQSYDTFRGMFLFLETPPVLNKRFIVDDWDTLNGILPQPFVEELNSVAQKLKGKQYIKFTVLIGYPIQGGTIHWQLISIEKDNFPVFVEKIHGARNLHIARLKKQPILWGETKNCSYQYFFGRGVLSKRITKSRILIIGLGAIGSMVAHTLCRGGALRIDLVDYDAKEPENVCRSEYNFDTGINDKVLELRTQLHNISPFIETSGNSLVTDAAKLFREDPESKQKLKEYFEGYDLIFDCSADNDLAFLLHQFVPGKELINISISNHAQELVCAVNPNLYSNMMHIFSILKKEEEPDLYNPTGCWNPTFKAGYNDIAVLVQYAIKQINNSFTQEKPLRNFYLSINSEADFQIQIKTF